MAKHIDWRRQFKKLQPYLDGKGGVVNIRYRGASCGANAFLSIFKSEFERRPHAEKVLGTSIMLAPENYRVRYLAGIQNEFSRIMGKPSLVRSKLASMIVDASVLSNNTAGGAQHIEANFYLSNDTHMIIERNEWVSCLISELRDYLKTKRFVIFMLCGSSDEQAEFWSSIWNQANELTREGLLLVRMIDEEVAADTRHLDMYEYEYDCELTLPPELDGSDVEHAIYDVAALIADKIPSQDSVRTESYAKAYVVNNKNDVSALHNRLWKFIADLQEY